MTSVTRRSSFRSRAGSTMHQAPNAVTEDCLLTSRVSEVTKRVCRPRALYALRDSITKCLNVSDDVRKHYPVEFIVKGPHLFPEGTDIAKVETAFAETKSNCDFNRILDEERKDMEEQIRDSSDPMQFDADEKEETVQRLAAERMAACVEEEARKIKVCNFEEILEAVQEARSNEILETGSEFDADIEAMIEDCWAKVGMADCEEARKAEEGVSPPPAPEADTSIPAGDDQRIPACVEARKGGGPK